MKTAFFYIKAFLQLISRITSEWFYYRGKFIAYKRAVAMAKRRYKLDHKTYYVVEGGRWTFFVGNSGEVDKLRRMRVFDKNVNSLYLNEIACFKIGNSCPKGVDYSQRLTFINN